MKKGGAFIVLLFLLHFTSCKQEAEVECFQMVHQSPASEYLKYLEHSNPPRERIIFFLKISGVRQVDAFKATLACQGSPLKLDLEPFAYGHKGFWRGNHFYVILATKYLEDEEIVRDLAAHCSTFSLHYTLSKIRRTVPLPKRFDGKTVNLTPDDAIQILNNETKSVY